MVPREKLSRINGLEIVLNGVVQLGGPVISALLLAFIKIDQVLWIDPATFVAAVSILFFIRIPALRKQTEKVSFNSDLTRGFSYVRRARGLIPLIFLATTLNFLLTPFSTLLPYFVKFDHMGGVTDLALVEAFVQAGFLEGGALMLLTKGSSKKARMFVGSVVLSFVGYAMVSFTPTGLFLFMALMSFLFAFPVPVANVSARTILQIVVPLDMQGRVSSVVISLASLASPVGMILSGFLAANFGTSNLFLASALIGILVTAAAWSLTGIRHVEQTIGQVDTKTEVLE